MIAKSCVFIYTHPFLELFKLTILNGMYISCFSDPFIYAFSVFLKSDFLWNKPHFFKMPYHTRCMQEASTLFKTDIQLENLS